MRVFYVHQYFVTPQQGGATRSYHLAKGMVDNGLEVEMITTHQQSFYDFRIIAGIRVHYLPVAYSQKMGFLRRVWAFLAFVRQAKLLIKKLPRPDYLYITSTPLTTGLIGLWAKRKFAIPYIFEVRDLWPDAPIQIGVIRNPLLKRYLWGMEEKIYKHALKIVALSPGIANVIRKKAPTAELTIIPNFADLSIFRPSPKSAEMLKKFGLEAKLTIIYAGALGKVNALHELLDLATQSNHQYLIMGTGSELEWLKIQSARHNLSQIRFFPFGSKEEVRDLMACADLAFISFERKPIFKTNSPNKFFDALAMGKAIITNQKGWIGDLVQSHQLGFYHDNSATDKTLQQLKYLTENPSFLEAMQANSRQLAEAYFSSEIAIAKLLHVIDPKKFPSSIHDEAYIRTA